MKRYETQLVALPTGPVEDAIAFLNEHGAQGWAVVHVTSTTQVLPGGATHTQWICALLQREVEESPEIPEMVVRAFEAEGCKLTLGTDQRAGAPPQVIYPSSGNMLYGGTD